MTEKLTIVGNHEENTIAQMQNCVADDAIRGVLCADGHLGYSQPVGGVVAYSDKISVSGVGYDIACGNKAVKTNLRWVDVQKFQSRIADQIANDISFGIGKDNKKQVDHELFDDVAWKIPFLRDLKQMARQQLGTVGSGNHYCDVFEDEGGFVWVGVHFGSRGLGHKIATNFRLILGGTDRIDAAPTLVDENSTNGQEYIAAMNLAGRYAYAGRDSVCDYIAKNILGGQIVESIHNHHNFAWKEEHDGQSMWVVRKGATPAFPGQRGFIGGSMGGLSVIIKGVDSEQSKNLLYSTVHGSGRVMSRTQAAGKQKWVFDPELKRKVKKIVSEGLVNETSMRHKIKNLGIELRGGGADEAPDVYRPLEDVLAHHAGTIAIETKLQPKIVVMAGKSDFDPYKD